MFVRSVVNFSTLLRQSKQRVFLKTFMHNVQQESKTQNESLSGKKQYVCGHCEWQMVQINSDNLFFLVFAQHFTRQLQIQD